MLRFLKVFISLLCLCCIVHVQAQTSLNIDSLFTVAEKAISQGRYTSARKDLNSILQENPKHYAAQVLKAQTFKEQNQYATSATLLKGVLAKDPRNMKALELLVDVELVSEHHIDALALCRKGLIRKPNSKTLLYKEALILSQLGRSEEALKSLDHLLALESGHQKANTLQQQLISQNRNQVIQLATGVDFFSQTFDPAFFSSLKYEKRESWGKWAARINYAQRFELTGVQGEASLYAKLSNNLKGHISYGYAGSDLFPNHRILGEIYSSLSESSQASFGVRYLDFSGDGVLFLTGSFHWQNKAYGILFRPFVADVGNTGGLNFSANLEMKRYFNSSDNFVGFVAGYGYSPDVQTIQASGPFSTEQLHNLIALRFELIGQKVIHDRWLASLQFFFVRQEQTLEQQDYLWISSAMASIGYKF